MTKSFQYESAARALPDGTYARLECVLEFRCRDRDGVDAEIEELTVWDIEQQADVPLQSLLPNERTAIERLAQQIADEYACEAYQDYAEGAADRALDEWKDRES